MLGWVVCRKAVLQEDSGVPSASAPEPVEIGATYRSFSSALSFTHSLMHLLAHTHSRRH